MEPVLLMIAALFVGLHFVHLTADFPNHSPWMDWAKYTDEGWYGDAAIRFLQRGHWHVPGDFNPAAALPVWPLVEGVVFSCFGVGLSVARALTGTIFVLILIASYALIRRWLPSKVDSDTPVRKLAPSLAVLLLALSPFCYVFFRMAILEPMLILLTLLALLTASSAPMQFEQRSGWRRYPWIILLGILLPAMILTKTTALFLCPAVLWMLWAAAGYQVRNFLKLASICCGLGIALWGAYFGLIVRPHFLEDYRYLFSANAYTGITLETALDVLRDTVLDGSWIGVVLYPASLVGVFVSLVLLVRRSSRSSISPLILALILWAGGYAAFLAYHNNLQPRYYLVVAVPLTLLVPVVFAEISSRSRASLRPIIVLAGVILFAAILLPDARQTIYYVRHPEYTFVDAAVKVRQVIADNPKQNPLVLSISGSNLSLMTGVPSICDDFGTMELTDRVAAYRPGWYVTWNDVEDDKMEALAPLYHLQRVAAFPVMDDPERNLMILYRLDPPTPVTPHHNARKPIPRFLQTSMGQQPSTGQLEH